MDYKQYRPHVLWLFSAFLIIIATVVIYRPGLYGPFVFDDLTNILLPTQIRISSLNFDALYHAAFWENSPVFGRPVAMLSFALNHYFTQFDAFWFKATNLVIHIINGILLFILTSHLLRQHLRNSALFDQINRVRWTALAVCVAWLLHPLNITSVLYVVQRMTSLMSLFTLLGLLGYLWGRHLIARDMRYGFVVIALSFLIFGLLATLSKQNGILLPLYAFIIEAWIYRFSGSVALIKSIRRFWTIVAVLLIALPLMYFAIKPKFLFSLVDYQYRDFTLEQRVLTEARALWFYLKLIIAPTLNDLGLYHDDFVVSTSLTDPGSTLIAVIGLVGVVIGMLFSIRRAPILSFGIAWFLASHIIESTIIPLELVHEHRNYLAGYGILLPLIYYLIAPNRKLVATLSIRRGIAAIYILLIGLVSHARAADWADPLVLYSSEVRHHPKSATAHTGLAILFHDNRADAQAENEFTAAAQLASQDSKPLIRLAQHQYLSRGHIPEGTIVELEQRMLNDPYSGITLWTYEPLLKATVKDRELSLRLIHIYERTINRVDINIGPAWQAYAHRTLGFAYRELKQYRPAIAQFEQARKLEPSPSATYYVLLGETYLSAGDKKAAALMLDQLNGAQPKLSDEDQIRLQRIKSSLSNAQRNPD